MAMIDQNPWLAQDWTPLSGNTTFLDQMMRERERREAERMRQEMEQRQQPQQQQGGMGGNMNMMEQFMGGSPAFGTGGAPEGWGAGYSPGMGEFGTSGPGGWESAGSATGAEGGFNWGAAGWWALLAAAIAANESAAEEDKARNPNKTQWAGDILSGRVLEQDFSKRWLPKIAGESQGGSRYANDKYGLATDAHILADVSTGDFSNAWDALRNDSSVARLLGKIF